MARKAAPRCASRANTAISLALTLEDGAGRLSRLMSTPRLLLSSDPALKPFANSVVGMEANPFMRVAHVDLDYVYDPDPAQTDRNLGELVQRILDMQINTVFLQAYADPEGDGLVKSVYFPNRWLPMRADLFKPRSLAIAQPRQRDGLRLDASAGL